MFEIKLLAGLCSLRNLQGNPSFLAFSWVLVAGNLRRSLAYGGSISVPAFFITWHSPCVSVLACPSSYKDTSHVGFGAPPAPVRLQPNLSNYICNDPTSK